MTSSVRPCRSLTAIWGLTRKRDGLTRADRPAGSSAATATLYCLRRLAIKDRQKIFESRYASPDGGVDLSKRPANRQVDDHGSADMALAGPAGGSEARPSSQASSADNQPGMIFCMVVPVHHRPHIRTAILRARGTVTIPQDVRDRLDLAEGDQFVVTVEDDRIVLTPTSVIPDDQAWFWSPEWQAKETEVDRAAASGERGTVFGDGEEFLTFLDENMKPGR